MGHYGHVVRWTERLESLGMLCLLGLDIILLTLPTPPNLKKKNIHIRAHMTSGIAYAMGYRLLSVPGGMRSGEGSSLATNDKIILVPTGVDS